MDEREDKWKKLTEITEEYQPDMTLPNEVIYKINQRESTVSYKKPFTKRVILLVAFLACVLVLSILLPIYLSSHNNDIPDIPDMPKITIYTSDSIQMEIIDDLDSFVEENCYSIKFFNDEFAKNQCGYIIEDNSKAYIVQDLFCFTDTGFDSVNLKIVLLENAEFEFFKDFVLATKSMTVNDVNIEYYVRQFNEEITYRAKFEYQNHLYFLEIKSGDDALSKIEDYINKLISI